MIAALDAKGRFESVDFVSTRQHNGQESSATDSPLPLVNMFDTEQWMRIRLAGSLEYEKQHCSC